MSLLVARVGVVMLAYGLLSLLQLATIGEIRATDAEQVATCTRWFVHGALTVWALREPTEEAKP